MDKILGTYKNGNYTVTMFSDGTKVRMNNEDTFIPEKPESIDLKITNQCNIGCPFCHEDSTPDGEHADLENLAFIDTLLPYTEIAVGGGNPLSHPGLVDFLRKAKERNLIANMTVNQRHFISSQGLLRRLSSQELVYGLGVSVTSVNDRLLEYSQTFPNAVVHVINGVVSMDDIESMCDKGLKLLILGYKDFRRGSSYKSKVVEDKMQDMYNALPNLMSRFKVISFDNLAVKQLDVRRIVTEKQWQERYMGDDGQFTMYIDAVKRQFAKSSTSTVRHELLDDIAPMFRTVRAES